MKKTSTWCSSRRRAHWPSLLLLGSQLFATAAFADDRESATRNAARELGTSGVEAYLDGRYDQANDELEKAYTILRVPSLGLWSARALTKRQQLVEAVARYTETIALKIPSGESAIQKKAIEDARKELAELRLTVPTLVIRVSDAEPDAVEVRLDGNLLPSAAIGVAQLVNPGRHDVVGQRGSERVTGSTTSSEGQHQEVELKFGAATAAAVATRPTTEPASMPATTPAGVKAAPTSKPNDAQRTWSSVVLAVGTAGLAFGGVTGFLAHNQHQKLQDSGLCSDGCPTLLANDVDKLHGYRTMSTVGFIAGGVLTAAGVVLWVSAPASAAPGTNIGLGPGGVTVEHRF
jgi:hypothetical protein